MNDTITQNVIFMIEIFGTIAFASSGALVAIKHNLDFFGVAVLGVTTACGGGFLRDVVLGIVPPNMFVHPIYTLVAIIVSNLIFFTLYINKDALSDDFGEVYDKFMTICDTLGLGVFTVLGVNTAIARGHERWFLLVFVGVITGVGGGLVRDLMVLRKPVVLTRHVYAVACLIGCIVYLECLKEISQLSAMILGAITIYMIRYMAIRYDWNLPRINL